MKIDFSKEWCVQMANLEAQAGADFDVGVTPSLKQAPPIAAVEGMPVESNIAFGRFVRLMRRQKQVSLERLAEDARVEITELVEIEEDARHRTDPRTVYQLANHFKIPTPKMMQLAGLSQPKDGRLFQEAVRFAARSEPIEELSEVERAALEAFVSVLSERS